MKKIFCFLIVLILLPINVCSLDINSKYVYFYNLDKNETIYEQDSHEKISIASMTKIMTAIVAIENIENLDEKVVLTSKDFKGLKEANASTAGFKKGETVTYRDLLYGLMLPSGADAALALANNIAGNETKFVEMMNEKAKELGLNNTHFENTTGLDEKGHYSSVYDVYVFLSYALENEEFKEIFTTKKYTTSSKRLTFKSTLVKSSDKYNLDTDYILGSKSGYTYDAGLCLASIAQHDGDTFLLVTAVADYKSGKPYHIIDSDKIYKYYFDNYSYRLILKEDDVIVTLKDVNDKEHIYYADETIELYLLNESKVESKYKGVDEITSDLKEDDLLGIYEITVDGNVVYTQDIYLEEDIINYSYIILTILFITLLSASILKLKKKKKKRGK